MIARHINAGYRKRKLIRNQIDKYRYRDRSYDHSAAEYTCFQALDGNAPSSLLDRLTSEKQKQQDNGYKIDRSLQIQCSGQENGKSRVKIKTAEDLCQYIAF